MTSIGKPIRERIVQPDVVVVPPRRIPAVSPKQTPAPVREKEGVPA